MNQPTNVTLTITPRDAEVILAALSKLPFETVADLFMNVRSQAMSQLNPPTADSNVEPVAPVQ